jgi:hypothetical protein
MGINKCTSAWTAGQNISGMNHLLHKCKELVKKQNEINRIIDEIVLCVNINDGLNEEIKETMLTGGYDGKLKEMVGE